MHSSSKVSKVIHKKRIEPDVVHSKYSKRKNAEFGKLEIIIQKRLA